MNTSVLIAFRETGDGWRTRLLDFVLEHLKAEHPEFEVVVASDDGIDPFHKSLALNRAARRAGGDTFYVLDADTWVPPDQVYAALEAGARWVKPWTVKLKLGRQATARLLDEPWEGMTSRDHVRLENRNRFWPAPPLLITREAWDEVGGMDETFRGWGGEDVAFAFAAHALIGMPVVVKGFGYHLWHPRFGRSGLDWWVGQDPRETNNDRLAPYKRARTPEEMRAVIASRG